MKIYISADIEGVCGSTHWDETDDKKVDYTEFKNCKNKTPRIYFQVMNRGT